jgi:S-formylglutathione hydrolase
MNAGIGRAAVIVTILMLSMRAFGQAPASAETAAPVHPPAGKYQRLAVHGRALEGNLEGDSPDRQVSIYLPPSYGRSPWRRYPVLYLLHGFTDSDDRWFGLRGPHFVNVPAAVDAAYQLGVKEMIVVMPNAFTKYLGSMYSNSVVVGDWETFIAEELVSYIDTHYRTLARRESRGLAGHSMGGYGTLRIGMKYPQVFSSIYAMSPCCLTPNTKPDKDAVARAAAVQSPEQLADSDFFGKATLATAAAWSPNPAHPPLFFDMPIVDGDIVPETIAQWTANSPLITLHQHVPDLKRLTIAFDAGDQEQFGDILPSVQALDRLLSSYGIAHVAEVFQGDHINRVAERLQTKVLPFFSEHLKF